MIKRKDKKTKKGLTVFLISNIFFILLFTMFSSAIYEQFTQLKNFKFEDKTINILPSSIILSKYKLIEYNGDLNSKEAQQDFDYNIKEIFPGVNSIEDLKDSDYDCLSDSYERIIGTDPYNPDTDNDKLLDCEELGLCSVNYYIGTDNKYYARCISEREPFGGGRDPHTDIWSKNFGTTDPLNEDTDLDGLSDYDELIYSPEYYKTFTNSNKYYTKLQYFFPKNTALGASSTILIKEIPYLCNGLDRNKGSNIFDQKCLLNDEIKQELSLLKDFINNGYSNKNIIRYIYTITKINKKIGFKLRPFTLNYVKGLIKEMKEGRLPLQSILVWVYEDCNIFPNKADTDNDGLSDYYELALNYQPCNKDMDSDFLPDGKEVSIGTDPTIADTDNDNLIDYYELKIGTDPLNPNTDGDNLNDRNEVVIEGWGEDAKILFRCNPLKKDTDGDGLIDGCTSEEFYNDQEFITCEPFAESVGNKNYYPCKTADSDNDGLTDNIDPHPLNPNLDPDNDGLTDREELKYGTNPSKDDTDGDELKDGEEIKKYNTNATLLDTDNDGLNDYLEIQANSDPNKQDTDDDGLSDYLEYNGWVCKGLTGIDTNLKPIYRTEYYKSNPTKTDTDNDGLTDFEEYKKCTDPSSADSDEDKLNDNMDPWPLSEDGDSDGIKDKEEIEKGLDPRNPDQDNDGIIDGEDEEIKTKIEKNVLIDLEKERIQKLTLELDGCNEIKDTIYGKVCYISTENKEATIMIKPSEAKLKITKQYSKGTKSYEIESNKYNIYINDLKNPRVTLFDRCSGNAELKDSTIKINLQNVDRYMDNWHKESCLAYTVTVHAYSNETWIDSATFYIVYKHKVNPKIRLSANWVKINNEYAKTGSLHISARNCDKITIKTNAYINGKHQITIKPKYISLYTDSFKLSPIPFETQKESYNLKENIKNDVLDKGKETTREIIEDTTNYHLTDQGKAILSLGEFASDLKEKGTEIGEAAAKITMYKSTGAKIIYGLVAIADTVEASVGGVSLAKDLTSSAVSKSNPVDDITDKIKSYTIDALKTYLKNKAEELEKEARKTTMIYNIVAECCFKNECTKNSTRVEGLGYEQ